MIYTNQMTGKYSHVLAIFNCITYYHTFLFYLQIPIKAPLKNYKRDNPVSMTRRIQNSEYPLIITCFLGGFPNGTIKKKQESVYLFIATNDTLK